MVTLKKLMEFLSVEEKMGLKTDSMWIKGFEELNLDGRHGWKFASAQVSSGFTHYFCPLYGEVKLSKQAIPSPAFSLDLCMHASFSIVLLLTISSE